MKKRMLSLLTVTLFFISAVCPVMASDDVNLIVNGGFETGDHTGWSAFNSAIIDTTSPHTGTYCAKVDKNSSYSLHIPYFVFFDPRLTLTRHRTQ